MMVERLEDEAPGDKTARLLKLAREIAAEDPHFWVVKGPGAGNHATNRFILELGERATKLFGEGCSEKRICGAVASAVDFYFEDEATIVEVALGLPNPATEFEKDIFKALLAQDTGNAVNRLVFISRPGAIKKCSQPARADVMKWAQAKHGLKIEIHELEGDPRRRARQKRTRLRAT